MEERDHRTNEPDNRAADTVKQYVTYIVARYALPGGHVRYDGRFLVRRIFQVIARSDRLDRHD
jgi:hypothetical protein